MNIRDEIEKRFDNLVLYKDVIDQFMPREEAIHGINALAVVNQDVTIAMTEWFNEKYMHQERVLHVLRHPVSKGKDKLPLYEIKYLDVKNGFTKNGWIPLFVNPYFKSDDYVEKYRDEAIENSRESTWGRFMNGKMDTNSSFINFIRTICRSKAVDLLRMGEKNHVYDYQIIEGLHGRNELQYRIHGTSKKDPWAYLGTNPQVSKDNIECDFKGSKRTYRLVDKKFIVIPNHITVSYWDDLYAEDSEDEFSISVPSYEISNSNDLSNVNFSKRFSWFIKEVVHMKDYKLSKPQSETFDELTCRLIQSGWPRKLVYLHYIIIFRYLKDHSVKEINNDFLDLVQSEKTISGVFSKLIETVKLECNVVFSLPMLESYDEISLTELYNQLAEMRAGGISDLFIYFRNEEDKKFKMKHVRRQNREGKQ